MTGLPNVGEVLRTHAQLFPDRVAARDLERTMTFRQWNARSCRLANALLGLGLGKGKRVAVLAYNCVEWLEIYAATAKAGLVTVPVNFRLVGAEIAYIVENCEAAALIVQDALVETVEQVRAELSVPPEFHSTRLRPMPFRLSRLRGPARSRARRRA
jgi:acyl-CoA synthetase (AMP-forming)/AMP-acid ligase II